MYNWDQPWMCCFEMCCSVGLVGSSVEVWLIVIDLEDSMKCQHLI